MFAFPLHKHCRASQGKENFAGIDSRAGSPLYKVWGGCVSHCLGAMRAQAPLHPALLLRQLET